MCAGLAGIAPASAWTVYDLTGPNGYREAVDRLYWSDADKFGSENVPLGASNHVRLELVVDEFTGKVNETRVKLTGFQGFSSVTGLSAEKDFILTLADDNNQATTDGTRLIIPNDFTGNYKTEACSTDETYFFTAGYRNDPESIVYEVRGEYTFYWPSRYASEGSPAQWVGIITESADGEFTIDFDEPGAFLSTSSWSGPKWAFIPNVYQGVPYNSYKAFIIDNYHIETFTPNAYFSCTVTPYNFQGGTKGSFGTPSKMTDIPVKVIMENDGTFKILNLFDTGYTIYPDDNSRFAPGYVTGYYDFENGYATLDGGQYGWHVPGTASYSNARNATLAGRMATIDVTTRKFDSDYNDIELVAQSGTDSKVAHKVIHNHWVSNGGTCRTYLSSGKLEGFPTFSYVVHYMLDGELIRFDSSSAYGDGSLDMSEDVTLDIEHNIVKFGADDKHVFIESDMNINQNDMYVDSYELWIVPGTFSEGSVTGTNFNHENGHNKGTLVMHVDADEMNGNGASKTRAVNDTHKFWKYIPKSEITYKNAQNKYSFYIKANYKPETGLKPTFHGLTTVTDDVITGIENIESEEAVSIKCGNNMISVDAQSVQVYTTTGSLIYDGKGGDIAVDGGIYIVKVGSTVSKVVVR